MTQAKLSKHWLQFADDIIVLTTLPQDNRLLLNLFTKWTHWADLVIRVDKCSTFGIKKTSTMSVQYQPYLLVDNEVIPPVKTGESFMYLGKQFNYNMDDNAAKSEIVSKINGYLDKINYLPVKSHDKIHIVKQYVYSKITWYLSIYQVGLHG